MDSHFEDLTLRESEELSDSILRELTNASAQVTTDENTTSSSHHESQEPPPSPRPRQEAFPRTLPPLRFHPLVPRKMASNSKVPKPGPAKLSPRAGLDEWLENAKQCKYLPEHVMKQLCEMVKECLMEGKIIY